MDEMTTILVVDDDQTICDFVGDILTAEGYIYEIALNAHEALAKMQNQPFDITLLDVKLPDRSGIDLLETSQSFSQTTSTIMMTAVKDLNIAIQAMKMGASDYVVKPFTIDRLTASITAVLKKRKGHNSVSIKTEKIEDVKRSSKAISQSIRTINALAMGVDAQVDYFDFHSRTVTEKTVDLAWRLGISMREIEKWKIARNEQYYEKRLLISSMLGKLERNPLAQVMLGLTNSVIKFTQEGMEQN